MERVVTVACVQAEPAILDREATLDRLQGLAAEAAGNGADLVAFPETFVAVYPSSRWARAFAAWHDAAAKETFARIAQSAVAVGSPAERRLGATAKALGIWLVTGVNEVEPERQGTIYNSLLTHAPDGSLALHHRKLVPTNHERLIWGQGDGRGLTAVETGFGRLGGLICWENYMPLARFALYEAGVELYVAATAADEDEWQATLVHLARESRAYVIAPCHFQRASSYPADFPLAAQLEGIDLLGRGGSAILAPDGSYLAGPLYDEEGILYAELDASRLLAERQRFDPVGHYHRPDVLRFAVNPAARAADAPTARPLEHHLEPAPPTTAARSVVVDASDSG
jgi:nitrilase